MFIPAVLANGIAHLCLWFSWSYYGQPSAAVFKDQLFVAINGRPLHFSGHLSRGPFNPDKDGAPSPFEYFHPLNVRNTPSAQAKLDIRDNRLLVFHAGGPHAIFKMTDLQLLEWSEFGRSLCKVRGYANASEFYSSFSSSTGERLLFPPLGHREPDVPVPPPVGFGANGERREDIYVRTARYDVQIAGEKTVRLFHAAREKLFVSIEPDYLNYWFMKSPGVEATNRPAPPDRELHIGKLPADFTERFAAYTSGNVDYIVTTNGKVYMSVAKGKTEVEVTAIWSNTERAIVGVVQDLANDAVYGWGFANSPDSGDRFYVRFDPKPVAKPYKLTVSLQINRSDAYLESYECARAFRTAGKK